MSWSYSQHGGVHILHVALYRWRGLIRCTSCIVSTVFRFIFHPWFSASAISAFNLQSWYVADASVCTCWEVAAGGLLDIFYAFCYNSRNCYGKMFLMFSDEWTFCSSVEAGFAFVCSLKEVFGVHWKGWGLRAFQILVLVNKYLEMYFELRICSNVGHVISAGRYWPHYSKGMVLAWRWFLRIIIDLASWEVLRSYLDDVHSQRCRLWHGFSEEAQRGNVVMCFFFVVDCVFGWDVFERKRVQLFRREHRLDVLGTDNIRERKWFDIWRFNGFRTMEFYWEINDFDGHRCLGRFAWYWNEWWMIQIWDWGYFRPYWAIRCK